MLFCALVICVKIRYSAEEMKGWSGPKEREREAHRSEWQERERERESLSARDGHSEPDWLKIETVKNTENGSQNHWKKTRSRKEENKYFSKERCRLPRLRYVALNTSSYTLLVTNGQFETAYAHYFLFCSTEMRKTYVFIHIIRAV